MTLSMLNLQQFHVFDECWEILSSSDLYILFYFECVETVLQKLFWFISATSLRQVQQERPLIVTRRLRFTTPEGLRQLQKKWISSVTSMVP